MTRAIFCGDRHPRAHPLSGRSGIRWMFGVEDYSVSGVGVIWGIRIMHVGWLVANWGWMDG